MKSKIRHFGKRFILRIRNIVSLRKNAVKWINFAVLTMCVAMFILALFSNVAHKIPLLSYFAKEMSLPNMHELSGTVEIRKDEEVNSQIKVSVGGYSAYADSDGTYELRFLATDQNDIPVVISIFINESMIEQIEHIDTDGVFRIKKNFRIILQE